MAVLFYLETYERSWKNLKKIKSLSLIHIYQFSVSDKVIRGGVKIQKRDLETGDTKPQGSATLKDTAFDIISLNDNSVLVEGKLYKKNEVVKTIHTDIEGVASTSADLLPYGKFRIVESEAPNLSLIHI